MKQECVNSGRYFIVRILLTLALAQGGSAIYANDAILRWGVGISFVKNLENANQFGADFGQGIGGDCSFQFLSNSRIQTRVRLGISLIGEGSGGFAQQDQMQTSSPAGPISWNFWSKGTIETLSNDWIFKFNKTYGPYLFLGAGVDFIQENRRILTHTPIGNGNSQDLWSRENKSLFGNFIPTSGVGWFFSNGIELEMRLTIDRAWFGDRSVTQTSPGNGGLLLSSFAVRKRF